jgi:GTP-binding protein HflX
VRVLSDLGADQKRTILVFNKVDRVAESSSLQPLRARFPEAHFVSVHSGEGLDALVEHIAEQVSNTATVCVLRIPASEGAALAKLHRSAHVLEIQYEGDSVQVTAALTSRLRAEYGKYVCEMEANFA